MKDITAWKLLGLWCVLMLSWPVALLWIRPDFATGNFGPAAVKLGVVLAVAAAASLLFTYLRSREWSMPTRRVQEFIAALPTSEIDLPVEGPPELQSLSRAMKAMAERVRQVVDQANIEGARRETILACMAEGVLAVNS